MGRDEGRNGWFVTQYNKVHSIIYNNNKYKKIDKYKKIMGCGAVCGASSSVVEGSK